MTSIGEKVAGNNKTLWLNQALLNCLNIEDQYGCERIYAR